MKKVFPVIVVLITLSVLGIMFIQMSWINNAIKQRHEEFQQEVESSMSEAKKIMQERFISMQSEIPLNEYSKQYFLEHSYTTLSFSQEEVKQILDKSLADNNIKQHYEYCIINIFNYPIFKSNGFQSQDAYSISLAPDNSALSQEKLYLDLKENKNLFLKSMAWMIVASVVFTIIIISAFAVTVRTLFNQKKLSEVKTDFINNMTHELKTPLATISLAIDALTNEKVIHDTDKIKYYSAMIKEENKRMNKQVEKILQAARIERQDIKLNLQELDAHEVIRKVADNLVLQIQEKKGTLELKLNASRHMIQADEVHFPNIIFNLLDNAIKYSGDKLHIEIETQSQSGILAIKVKDNGIGMNKETQLRVFEKFYRAHTGNLHNVKGFGLGLSYVKVIAEAHGGKVKVESTQGKGSTFTVFIPLS